MPASEVTPPSSHPGSTLGTLACKLAILVLCLEAFGRIVNYSIPFWYEEASRTASRNPVRFIFIGSSRVASAIDAGEFARIAAGEDAPGTRALNMGRGYSTMTEHFFGLKKIATVNPGALRGAVVFIEAPMGQPDLRTWAEPWYHREYPELLVNSILIEDLLTFWRAPGTGIHDKLEITARKLSGTLKMLGNGIYYLAGARTYLQKTGLVSGISEEPSAGGGVLTEYADVINARNRVLMEAGEERGGQTPLTVSQGDHSVLNSIIRLVLSRGGRVVLFRMPLCSLQQRPYETDSSFENQRVVKELLDGWGICLLEPAMQTSDDDFPDYVHLKSSRAREFSRSLAKTYLQSSKK